MSLNIYMSKEEIPEGIRLIMRNDTFFSGVSLRDTKETRHILKAIDLAEYGNTGAFIGRDKELGLLNKDWLSTGSKTLINVIENPEFCFYFGECGHNVFEIMYEAKEGNIYWQYPMLFRAEDVECDIVIKGKRFTKFTEFQHYIMDEMLDEG